MRQDRCDLATGEGDILARKLIDCPGSGIEGVVESKITTQAPVPAAQDTRKLQGQDLLIHSPPISTQAYYKLVCNDCLVLVHSRIKLPTTELASPAPGDGASSNATQGATVDLSQGYRIEHVDERGLLFHLRLPVPPLQVPQAHTEMLYQITERDVVSLKRFPLLCKLVSQANPPAKRRHLVAPSFTLVGGHQLPRVL